MPINILITPETQLRSNKAVIICASFNHRDHRGSY